MVSLRKWTEPSQKTNIAPPVCCDLKPMLVFQAFSLFWQPLPPKSLSLGTPFSPGQVGKLIGAVVANHSPSLLAQPLRHWKPLHQPRTSPMAMVLLVPSRISLIAAAQL